jgi:hypothetical protein
MRASGAVYFISAQIAAGYVLTLRLRRGQPFGCPGATHQQVPSAFGP